MTLLDMANRLRILRILRAEQSGGRAAQIRMEMNLPGIPTSIRRHSFGCCDVSCLFPLCSCPAIHFPSSLSNRSESHEPHSFVPSDSFSSTSVQLRSSFPQNLLKYYTGIRLFRFRATWNLCFQPPLLPDTNPETM
jgi:hypothetical protein